MGVLLWQWDAGQLSGSVIGVRGFGRLWRYFNLSVIYFRFVDHILVRGLSAKLFYGVTRKDWKRDCIVNLALIGVAVQLGF